MAGEFVAYVPETVSEIVDLLSSMMLSRPTMIDEDFPGQSVDTQFGALHDGLALVRRELGEGRYAALVELANRMRAHFEADPDDTNGEAHKGYLLINEMQAILSGSGRR